MKRFILFIFLFITTTLFAQQQIVVNGWYSLVTLPVDYNYTTIKYPTIIFFPGLGEVGNNYSSLRSNGVHAYLDQGGIIPGFIVISLQPQTPWPTELSINNRIQSLIGLYRIDTNRINLTGLSMGGWCSSTYVSGGYPKIKSIVTVEGVIPDDNSPYPQSFSNWFGRHLCFEQRLDGRGGFELIKYINTIHPGQGIFIETNFGGGGHCCWSNFYGGQGVQPTKFILDGKSQNIYEWITSINQINIVNIDLDSVRLVKRKPEFYLSNMTLNIKSSKFTNYQIYNSNGQIINYGVIKPGSTQIPLFNLTHGFYLMKTEFNLFKFIL